jgi:hypothetical protein
LCYLDIVTTLSLSWLSQPHHMRLVWSMVIPNRSEPTAPQRQSPMTGDNTTHAQGRLQTLVVSYTSPHGNVICRVNPPVTQTDCGPPHVPRGQFPQLQLGTVKDSNPLIHISYPLYRPVWTITVIMVCECTHARYREGPSQFSFLAPCLPAVLLYQSRRWESNPETSSPQGSRSWESNPETSSPPGQLSLGIEPRDQLTPCPFLAWEGSLPRSTAGAHRWIAHIEVSKMS